MNSKLSTWFLFKNKSNVYVFYTECTVGNPVTYSPCKRTTQNRVDMKLQYLYNQPLCSMISLFAYHKLNVKITDTMWKRKALNYGHHRKSCKQWRDLQKDYRYSTRKIQQMINGSSVIFTECLCLQSLDW